MPVQIARPPTSTTTSSQSPHPTPNPRSYAQATLNQQRQPQNTQNHTPDPDNMWLPKSPEERQDSSKFHHYLQFIEPQLPDRSKIKAYYNSGRTQHDYEWLMQAISGKYFQQNPETH